MVGWREGGLVGGEVGGEVGEVSEGGERALFGGVVSSWRIGGILAGEEGEGGKLGWGGVRRVEGAGGFFLW